MSMLLFHVPPFPTFIMGGEAKFQIGQKHIKRTFTLFDLLYVKKGTLYICENEIPYTVSDGEYLILAPDLEHLGYMPCREETDYYWLHFQIDQGYKLVASHVLDWGKIVLEEGTIHTPPKFELHLPRFGKVKQRDILEGTLKRLVDFNEHQSPESKLKQQTVFEEFILSLQKEALHIPSTAEQVTQKALDYIHMQYQEPIKMEDISHVLLLNADYITRCMQHVMGMSPTKYVTYYRLSIAKHLLATTNAKMSAISKQVGIADPTYFSKLFKKIEGITPIEYRRVVGRREEMKKYSKG